MITKGYVSNTLLVGAFACLAAAVADLEASSGDISGTPTSQVPQTSTGPVTIFDSSPTPLPGPSSPGGCIADSEAPVIAQRWLDCFATGGIGGLSAAVTPNITIYDEGATNGSTVAEVMNSTQLNDTISASAYGGGGVTNVTYTIVDLFHSCNRIAVRWEESALTTDSIGYGSRVPANQTIHFKGTDLLTINLESKKVQNVTTSADLLNYYRALGYPLGVEATDPTNQNVRQNVTAAYLADPSLGLKRN